MMEHPLFLPVGTIMVALMVAAWLFPEQKWLEPFRAPRLPRPPARKQPESPASFAFQPLQYDRSAAAAPTHIETRLAARQQSFQRFNRIHAGVSIMVAGVVILFGHYVMARMTASDPEADPGRLLAVGSAALFVVVGAAVMFTRGRDR